MILKMKRWVRRDKPADESGSTGGTVVLEEDLPESEDADVAALEAGAAGPADGAAAPADEAPAGEAPPAGAEDDPELFIGEAPAPNEAAAAPSWVKRLRKRVREQAEQLAAVQAGGSAPAARPTLGPKPKVEDFDYDTDKYTAALDKWHEKKVEVAKAEQQARDQQAQEERAWQSKVSEHEAKGKALPFKDYEDCSAAAEAELSPVQRAIIVKGASNSALVMYALGRNLQKAEELASITDPIEFAFAVADFQLGISMKPRTPKTTPDKTVASGAPASVVLSDVDKKLNALREQAMNTGDMGPLLAYKRKVAAATK